MIQPNTLTDKNPTFARHPAAPAVRELHVYAFDLSLASQLDTWEVNETVIQIPCEGGPADNPPHFTVPCEGDAEPATAGKLLLPGPIGEYLEGVDVDPASGCAYAPVDLNHRYVLAQKGLDPSDGDPQFHQILQELDTLIQSSQPVDVIVFQYAGHGTYVPDSTGDEGGDRRDEALCPYDFDEGHLLVDDDLGEVLARTPDGVSVTCFMDCCHSGTNTRFGIGEPRGPQLDERARHLALKPAEPRRAWPGRRWLVHCGAWRTR